MGYCDVDVLIGLQYGDESKGKVSKALLEINNYDAVCKFNGGGNSGHTVYIGEDKYVAHYLTSGIYSNECDVIIGPSAVVSPSRFEEEYNTFKDKFNLEGRVFVDPKTHLVKGHHITEDSVDKKLGTTRQGVGPTIRDKYARKGVRAGDASDKIPDEAPIIKFVGTPENKSYYDYFNQGKKVLMEGSQGYWLDIEHGNYPYVTSSHMHPLFALSSFALPHHCLRAVYGVAKPYETYSGFNENQLTHDYNGNQLYEPDVEIFEEIRKEGEEFGATTGRPRHIGFLNLNMLVTAVQSTGVSNIIMSKMDILEKIGAYFLYHNNELIRFSTSEEFRLFIEKAVGEVPIIWSYNRETI